QALPLHVLDGALPALVGRPVVLPHVELHQVDAVHAEVFQALFGVLYNVVRRENVFEREAPAGGPLAVFGRDLRRGVQPPVGVLPDKLSKQALAAALAVGPRRVEEVAPQLDGAVERAQRLLIDGARPTAHTPHAVADLADLPAQSPESTVLH